MALLKCTECGHDVSDKAASCPNCGCPIICSEENPPKKSKSKWVLAIVIAVAVVAVAVGCWFAFGDKISKDDSNAIVELTPEFIEKVQKYDQLTPFSEGRAAVRRGDKWGYINTKGDEVIECQFDRAEVFHEGITQIVTEDKPYYINREGDKLFYGEGGRFSQGLALLDDGRVVNPKGEEVFKLELYTMAYSMSRVPNSSYYTEFPYFIDGVITVWQNEGQKSYDINGREVPLREIPDEIRQYKEFTDDVDYEQFNTGNHTGLKDENGKTVIAPLYTEISDISNGVVLVAYRENDAYYFGLDEQGTGLKATDGDFEEYAPRFYAYADLNGNTTFPQSTLDHIAEANRIGEERWKSILSNREVEAERSCEVKEDSKCPEWIGGTWKWSGYINGYNLGCAISFNLETGRYVLNTMDGDTELGTFTYDAYKKIIHCRPNNSSGYSETYEVDTYNNRISLGDGQYFEHIGS